MIDKPGVSTQVWQRRQDAKAELLRCDATMRMKDVLHTKID
jgi:hypothetical protein